MKVLATTAITLIGLLVPTATAGEECASKEELEFAAPKMCAPLRVTDTAQQVLCSNHGLRYAEARLQEALAIIRTYASRTSLLEIKRSQSAWKKNRDMLLVKFAQDNEGFTVTASNASQWIIDCSSHPLEGIFWKRQNDLVYQYADEVDLNRSKREKQRWK